MKAISYLKKFSLILRSRLYMKCCFLEPNLYLFNLDQKKLPSVRSICFELNDSEFVHLGDHLFFMPLIKSLMERGYPVEVSVSPQMYPLFFRLGLPVVEKLAPYDQYDLVVSRFELIPKLSQFKALLVNVSENLSMPICSQLLHSFSHYFDTQLESKVDYSCLTNPTILAKLNLPTNQKLLLFNPYCNSSSYLINRNKKMRLVEVVKSYTKDAGIAVVLVGTQEDKMRDNSDYDFDYFDLRGRTDVSDVFELVNHPHTSIYVGFDAFVMHVFSLLGKKSLVKFRGRLTQRQSEMLSKYHVNLFNGDHHVTLV